MIQHTMTVGGKEVVFRDPTWFDMIDIAGHDIKGHDAMIVHRLVVSIDGQKWPPDGVDPCDPTNDFPLQTDDVEIIAQFVGPRMDLDSKALADAMTAKVATPTGAVLHVAGHAIEIVKPTVKDVLRANAMSPRPGVGAFWLTEWAIKTLDGRAVSVAQPAKLPVDIMRYIKAEVETLMSPRPGAMEAAHKSVRSTSTA